MSQPKENSNRTKVLACLLALASIVALHHMITLTKDVTFDPKKNTLSRQTLWIFEKPDSFELLSLGPDMESQNWALGVTNSQAASHKPEMLWRREVLGRAAITNREEQLSLISSIEKSLQLADGKRFACFEPHHALRLKRGDQSADLIICFECLSLREISPTLRTLLIDHTQRTNFDAALIRHGLPITTNSF